MGNCIIYYEHIVRDYQPYEEIKNTINEEGKGKHKAVMFSNYYEWADSLHYLKKNNVDLILIPWMRWSPHFDYMWPFYKANPDIKFLIINSEQIGSPFTTGLLIPHNDFAKKGVYHCAWTENYKKLLMDSGVPEENIFITGNPKLAYPQSTKVNKKELAKKFGLDESKPWILYAESRNPAAYGNKERIEKQLSVGASIEDVEENKQYYVEGLNETIAQMHRLPKTFFEKYVFIYRLHPGMAQNFEIPNGVNVINDLPMGDWLPNIDCLVTPGSTSSFEADIIDKPVLLHTPIEFKPKFSIIGVDSYHRINNLIEINEDTMDKALSIQSGKKIYSKYVGEVNTEVNKNIGRIAISLMENNSVLPVKPPKWSIRIALRMYFYDKLCHLFYNLGLIQKLKWPKSAYRNLRDIPPNWIKNNNN